MDEKKNSGLETIKKHLVSHGWNCDWDEGMNLQYNKDKLLLRIDKGVDRALVAVCPVDAFDRWANSRHVKFSIYLEWENGVQEKLLAKYLSDAELLCSVVPERLFDSGITIEL